MKRLLVLVLCLGLALSMAAPAFAVNPTFQLTVNGNLKFDPVFLPFWSFPSLTGLSFTDGANTYNWNYISWTQTGPYTYKAVIEITGYSKFGQDFPIPKNGVRLFYHGFLAFNSVSFAAGNFTVDTGTQTVYATPGGNATADITINCPNGASRTVVPKVP